MKESWGVEKFEKCLEKVTYTNKILRKDFKEQGDYPVVSQEKDLINGYWDNETDLFKVEKPVVVFGDHTQVKKYIDFDFVLGADGVKILKPKKHIDSKYFYYYLLNTELRSLGYARHYRLLKEVMVSYPKSLSEQQRIVSLLDHCFAAIDQAKANAEQNLQNAKELFESYLKGVFEKKGDGWEEISLGEIGKVSMCKRIYKKETSDTGEIPFYKIGTFGKEPDAFITKELYDEYRDKFSFPKKGDIMLSASGTIGRRVRYDGEPAYFQDSNIVWIDNDEKLVSNDYLYFFYDVCDWEPSKGATIARLYNDDLRKMKISFPSLKEQDVKVNQFKQLYDDTQKLETIYQKKIDDLEELKKSILQKAFAGELKTEKMVEKLEEIQL